MPRKRRPRFNAAKAVRAIARERVGAPPPSRPISDKRHKSQKHKKDLLREHEEAP